MANGPTTKFETQSILLPLKASRTSLIGLGFAGPHGHALYLPVAWITANLRLIRFGVTVVIIDHL
jgi:hypothetical protein